MAKIQEERTAEQIAKAIDFGQLNYGQSIDLNAALVKAINAMAYWSGSDSCLHMIAALQAEVQVRQAECFRETEGKEKA